MRPERDRWWHPSRLGRPEGRSILLIALIVVALALTLVLGWLVGRSGRPGTAAEHSGPSSSGTVSLPTGGAHSTAPKGSRFEVPIAVFRCPSPTVRVSTADQLRPALADARPGAVIQLADGVYQGTFVAKRSGTAAAPIYLCGGSGAVLDGGSTSKGYVLHLDGAAHWRVQGLTIRNGMKGVMLDSASDVGLQDLTVQQIGDEAVHLRRDSTGNVVRGLTVSDTGLRMEKFGEGIYVGTAKSNWCQITGCRPDRSDRNVVIGNRITRTTAENVDIKEGTSSGVIADNSFDGTGMSAASSWVNVKGNAWLITGNRGVTTTKDGFQTHVVVEGWGDANVFSHNVAQLSGADGVGFYLHEQGRNRVLCDNQAPGAEELSNDPCTAG